MKLKIKLILLILIVSLISFNSQANKLDFYESAKPYSDYVGVSPSPIENSYGVYIAGESHQGDYGYQPTYYNSRNGETVERFEVRHGDCNAADCFRDRQRYLRKLRNNNKNFEKLSWNSFSFFIPNNWLIQPAGVAIWQIRLIGQHGSLLQVLVKDKDTIQIAMDNNHTQKCDLIGIDDAVGNWTDVVLKANLSPKASNPVEVWVNNQKIKCQFDNPIIGERTPMRKGKKYKTGETPFSYSYGIYQSFVSRWLDVNKTKEVRGDVDKTWLTPSKNNFISPDNTPFNEDWGVELPTAVIYFDNVKVHKDSFDEVNIFKSYKYDDLKSRQSLVKDVDESFVKRRISAKKIYNSQYTNEKSRLGKLSDRIELRHGDCAGSDCSQDRQRAQKAKYAEFKPESIGWYSGSIFIEKDFFIQPAGTGLIGNAIVHKGEGKGKTIPWQIGVKDNDYIQLASHNAGKCDLIKIDDAVGQWVDYMIRADYSETSSNPIDVWINGRNVGCKLNNPLVPKGVLNKNKTYDKRHNYGIYQTFGSRWLDKNKTKEVEGDIDESKGSWRQPSGKLKSPDMTPFDEDWGVMLPTGVVFFDNILVGDSKSEVNLFYQDFYLNLQPLQPLQTYQNRRKYPNNLIKDYGSFQKITRDENDKEWGYLAKEDITGSAPTKYIEIFELRDGDCYETPKWSDCKNDKERVELMQDIGETLADFDYWYGWSVYLPEDFETIHPSTVKFGRFKSKKQNFDFILDKKGMKLKIETDNKNKFKYKLIRKKKLLGHWNKVEVHAKWTEKDSGFFKVWINGEQKTDYKGPTAKGKDMHFRYGISRQGLSRYKEKYGVEEIPMQKVYYSNIKRADTREGLLP